MVIKYDRAWFPDDPNFIEANMAIVSLDPVDGTLYSYPTTVDTQAAKLPWNTASWPNRS